MCGHECAGTMDENVNKRYLMVDVGGSEVGVMGIMINFVAESPKMVRGMCHHQGCRKRYEEIRYQERDRKAGGFFIGCFHYNSSCICVAPTFL